MYFSTQLEYITYADVKLDSPEFLEDSVFFILYDKIDVIYHDGHISILRGSFYNEEEIKNAKLILRNLLKCESEVADRRGDARKKNFLTSFGFSLRHSASLLSSASIANTRRLPPVSINHIDAAALLKGIMQMRTEMLRYKFAQSRQE